MGKAVMTEIKKEWSVSDGRECVGHVVLDDDGAFVAVDVTGRVVGRFTTCIEASRAIENGERRDD
jgi:hypothetical protein